MVPSIRYILFTVERQKKKKKPTKTTKPAVPKSKRGHGARGVVPGRRAHTHAGARARRSAARVLSVCSSPAYKNKHNTAAAKVLMKYARARVIYSTVDFLIYQKDISLSSVYLYTKILQRVYTSTHLPTAPRILSFPSAAAAAAVSLSSSSTTSLCRTRAPVRLSSETH